MVTHDQIVTFPVWLMPCIPTIKSTIVELGGIFRQLTIMVQKHQEIVIGSDKDFIQLVAKLYSKSHHISESQGPKGDVLLSLSYQAGPDQVPLPSLLLHAG